MTCARLIADRRRRAVVSGVALSGARRAGSTAMHRIRWQRCAFGGKAKVPTKLLDGLALVYARRRIILIDRPQWWVIENPVGNIENGWPG